ncbi:hypothetical protein [Nostoc sp.]|uniref:hypothetical protein n=1 Tax=Nostoc sp. TaxID=1180 RepID=UPI002FFC5AC9
MLRNLNRWCVAAQRNAPTIQGALAYGVTHPTSTLYFFIYIEFFSPTYLPINLNLTGRILRSKNCQAELRK